MVILIAGSTGFVGGNVALKLKERDHKVLALARGGRRNPKAQRLLEAGVEVLDGDLTRSDSLFVLLRRRSGCYHRHFYAERSR